MVDQPLSPPKGVAMGPMVPVVDQRDGGLDQRDPFGGEYGRERLAEGQPPMAPPNLGFVLVSFTSKFTNNLGLVCM